MNYNSGAREVQTHQAIETRRDPAHRTCFVCGHVGHDVMPWDEGHDCCWGCQGEMKRAVQAEGLLIYDVKTSREFGSKEEYIKSLRPEDRIKVGSEAEYRAKIIRDNARRASDAWWAAKGQADRKNKPCNIKLPDFKPAAKPQAKRLSDFTKEQYAAYVKQRVHDALTRGEMLPVRTTTRFYDEPLGGFGEPWGSTTCCAVRVANETHCWISSPGGDEGTARYEWLLPEEFWGQTDEDYPGKK